MEKPQLIGTYQVESTININAPIQQAWQVLRDFGDATWAPGVKESYAIGKSEMGVGAGRHCALEGFGEIDEYITHWSEGTGFAYSVSPLGPLNNANSSWWLTEIGEQGCELSIIISYDIRFGLFGRMMHKLIMRSKLETSLPQTAAAVKSRVEGRLNMNSETNGLAFGH
jgi:hypothetical protein